MDQDRTGSKPEHDEGVRLRSLGTGPEARILLVLTYRPRYRPPWPDRRVDRIQLQPLSDEESLAVVREVLGGGEIPEALVRLILARAEGNPFFLEEMALAVRDAGGVVGDRAVPETIEEVLLDRLRRLRAPHRHLLTVAAVIGKDVPLSLLRTVAALPEVPLGEGLDELVRLEFLLPLDVGGDSAYTFKHALTHEVAYSSVAATERRALHARIVSAIESMAGDRLAEQTERLAHHALMGELWAQAVTYSARSAQRAVERSANAEAIAYVERGLDALRRIPVSPERTRSELGLRMSLAVPLIALRGYSSPEVEETLGRANELCVQLGDTPSLANVLWAQWAFNLVRGNLPRALDLAQQYRALGETINSVEHVLESCQLMGLSLFYLGQPAEARPHLERGMGLYDPAIHHALIFQHGGVDTGVAIETHLALVLWLLGYPARALAMSERALALGQRLSHPLTLGYAHLMRAWVCGLCGRADEGRASADAAVAICAEGGFTFWGSVAAAHQGHALAEQGLITEGLGRMREGWLAAEATGARLFLTYPLAVMAAAHGRTATPAEGLEVIARTLALIEATDDRTWEAELYRIRADLLAASDPDADIEELLRRALGLARDRHEKSLELRAALSLAGWLSSRGRPDEGRRLLAPVYAWFTEGLDTPDLRQARALLERDGASVG